MGYSIIRLETNCFPKNNNDASNHKNLDDQGDDLNLSCVACLAENTKVALSIENLYNQQPSKMFKYHVGMCSLIFLSLTSVLLICDLKKYTFKYNYYLMQKIMSLY